MNREIMETELDYVVDTLSKDGCLGTKLDMV